MLRGARAGVWLLAASVVLLAVVGDLHVHADHHEGTCLDRPDGDHGRLHAHGPCGVCQSTRHSLAEPASATDPAGQTWVEGALLAASAGPASARPDLSTPPRAPPVPS